MPDFFKEPILNSPYEEPRRHWILDDDGQPTTDIQDGRRQADFLTPIPKSKREQAEIVIDEGMGLSTDDQQYHATIINQIRDEINAWRRLPNERQWGVTAHTAALLKHWRREFIGFRPFFCQLEAVETVVWLTEVAPRLGRRGPRFIQYLKRVNEEANPNLNRLALKMATGAGKTAVMAMLIAWQTVNAVRRPQSPRFTKGFLVVAPGITIKDRLRVLLPNDPDNYYTHPQRQLLPDSMQNEIKKAKIVITNYHAFKKRDRLDISKGARQLLHGSASVNTLETDPQMIRRVMPELMNMKNIFIMNDEAHHCYREKEEADAEEKALKGDDKKEAKENREAARLWINGIEAVGRTLGPSPARVIDLSATPFFLRGSGYAEGTLFPWTMSDFSLMDAIECGIVKLPRVPVADNLPQSGDMPKLRNLWEHIGKRMPKKRVANLDPEELPNELQTALEAVYGHYSKTFQLHDQAERIEVPPCFIVVCSNTSVSKLVYDYIAGYWREDENGKRHFKQGRLELLRNYDDDGNAFAMPKTLLIDSRQLESGDALTPEFRKVADKEIDRFRREIRDRTGQPISTKNIPDEQILREVMNTVGKPGQLGADIRCVVSVSMLTEGWDANNVTHILGVRAFGTQLLCEQAVGRALRRQSYLLNDEGLFNVEYADILGVPFDFTAKPVPAPPTPPPITTLIQAQSPERDPLEIRFPRVMGYRVDKPSDRLDAAFTDESRLTLTPEIVGPTKTRSEGIVGEGADLTLEHLRGYRLQKVEYFLTHHMLMKQWRDPDEEPRTHLFGQLKRVVRRWMNECFECKGGTMPAQLMWRSVADMACERIDAAVTRAGGGENLTKAILEPYNAFGSSANVQFTTAKTDLYRTDPRKCHVNYAVLDSGWEGEFCRAAEAHPRVKAYVKNAGLGFEIPYRSGGEQRAYLPDYIVQIDDGRGEEDLLNLVAEIKGLKREEDREKIDAAATYWVPGVNNRGGCGRWAFAEFADLYEMETELARLIQEKRA